METLADLFTFPPINRLHHDRTRRIHAVIRPRAQRSQSDIGPAADYCIAHHSLEGAEAAARADDTATFDWYVTHPDVGAVTNSTRTAVGRRVVVAPELAELPRSAISETPYYVLGPGTESAPPYLGDLAADAYGTATEAGFGELLAAHAVVLCLLRSKKLGETLDSWTISRLPGTVFMDHVGDPVVLARDLVHEAGHNWLNDALTATGCKVDDNARFHSPLEADDAARIRLPPRLLGLPPHHALHGAGAGGHDRKSAPLPDRLPQPAAKPPRQYLRRPRPSPGTDQ